MCQITAKWPSGRVTVKDGYTEETARLTADFLWAVGVDDVKIECVCNECETCSDKAVWRNA